MYKILLVFFLIFNSTESYARTLVEKSLSNSVTVFVRRVNSNAWTGTILYTTLDENGEKVAQEEIDVTPLLSSGDSEEVVRILNGVWNQLHTQLSIPTPTPSPEPTPTPGPTATPE